MTQLSAKCLSTISRMEAFHLRAQRVSLCVCVCVCHMSCRVVKSCVSYLFVAEELRREVEDHVEHGGLSGERGGAVFGQRVALHLRIDVVRPKAADDHLHHRRRKREPARAQREALVCQQ